MLEANSSNHLGQGLAFPLQVNLQGNLRLSPQVPNIEESMLVILRTHFGERVYRPDFGSRLGELVFAPMNTQTLLLAKLYTQEALSKWEPRIVIDAIRTEADPVRDRIDIIIEYHPTDSHEQRSLVYPFYLNG
ncbi:GPW/gp25 family protein [Calothrix sp. 336/3]|uniref:GPW/gp25 family protein n=1 Tax=Calothrix sp. 336/3 TaxID=1337936 RepID=UPI0004E34015|nr:GPW/gp25 family protein [Calothrix sp. 336/3]AKG20487.1 baseplate protein [Calothrix sp. 336/3]